MSTLQISSHRIKDMVVSDRPQERLERHGAEALSDREILAMILRSGPKGVDVLTMSGQLIDQAGSLSRLLRWSAEDFQTIHGIGKVKSLQLLAVMSFAKRILQEDHTQETLFDSPEVVARHFRTLIAGLEVEKFWVLCLDRKNRLLRRIEATSGTATCALVHPREVFREAIRLSAAAIIAVHNHPSGDPAPSRADIVVTRQLNDAAKVIGIDLLDHIIVGQRNKDPKDVGLFSFNDAGLI
ncbi:DNA repair protein RadC [Opitutales bacterium]|jgi:DNA repair protein RadC|nr:DNA repair protein RadC [Opitutales bacterium]MDB2310722.1 DNA repair protein RadC [Opitutales bacterium]MDB2506905.1 DNA repair protein RadC [Opitutales bacterium]MDB2681083.1 DNA repair protein RadC [Opitutales bacterium]MDG1668555.1 DNA repair protein RadC [Opitutae bacterium]